MQHGLFAEQGGLFGRTSPEHSAATKGEILLSLLEKWQGANCLSPAMVGERKAWRWVQMDSSNGLCLTRNGSEWRNGGAACSLSSILETGPIDPRYFLSPTACAGIIRRSEKRGKELPEHLAHALQAVADSEPTSK